MFLEDENVSIFSDDEEEAETTSADEDAGKGKYSDLDIEDPSEKVDPADEKSGEDEKGEKQEDEYPESLLAEAVQSGLTEDEARQFTPDALRSALAVIDRQTMKVFADGSGEEDVAKSADKKKQDTGEKKGVELSDEEKFMLELDPEEVHPVLVEAFGKAGEHFNKLVGRVKQAEERLGKAMEFVENQLADVFITQVDTQIEKLGADYEELFGKGGSSELKNGSDAQKTRTKLMNAMFDISTAYEARGKKVNVPTLFNKALRMEFGDHIAKLATKEVVSKVKKRGKTTTERPGRQAGRKAESPEMKAEKAVAAFMEERGLNDDESFDI